MLPLFALSIYVVYVIIMKVMNFNTMQPQDERLPQKALHYSRIKT